VVNVTKYENINVGRIRQKTAQLEWPIGAALPEVSLKSIQNDYAQICKVGQRKMNSVDLGLKSFASPLCFLLLLTSNSIS
jgi:hypothetical protein